MYDKIHYKLKKKKKNFMSFKNKLEIQKKSWSKSRKIYITEVDWKLILKILSEPITLGKKNIKNQFSNKHLCSQAFLEYGETTHPGKIVGLGGFILSGGQINVWKSLKKMWYNFVFLDNSGFLFCKICSWFISNLSLIPSTTFTV